MRPGDRMLPPLARGLSRIGTAPSRLRIMTGLALAAAAALLVTVVRAADHAPEAQPTGDLVRVGVVEGQSIAGYLRSSRGELAALLPASGSPVTGETWALVSLTAYLAPDKLQAALAGVPVAEVYARAAEVRGYPGRYVLPLVLPTHQPALSSLSDRALREQLFRASVSRGARGDGNDTRDLVRRILRDEVVEQADGSLAVEQPVGDQARRFASQLAAVRHRERQRGGSQKPLDRFAVAGRLE